MMPQYKGSKELGSSYTSKETNGNGLSFMSEGFRGPGNQLYPTLEAQSQAIAEWEAAMKQKWTPDWSVMDIFGPRKAKPPKPGSIVETPMPGGNIKMSRQP